MKAILLIVTVLLLGACNDDGTAIKARTNRKVWYKMPWFDALIAMHWK